jgi:hypothetical protein
MSPDDTLPPAERPTLPELSASNDTDPPPAFGEVDLPAPAPPSSRPPLAIRAGQAQHVLSAALDDLARAFQLVEATSMALARQLDAQATEGP